MLPARITLPAFFPMTTDAPIPLSAEASRLLSQMVSARAAVEAAARDTAVAADELRRYARFSRPGQPSAQIVQLRQKQATARLDSARAKQAFLQAARGFVAAAGITVPTTVSLETYVLRWMAGHPDEAA